MSKALSGLMTVTMAVGVVLAIVAVLALLLVKPVDRAAALAAGAQHIVCRGSTLGAPTVYEGYGTGIEVGDHRVTFTDYRTGSRMTVMADCVIGGE